MWRQMIYRADMTETKTNKNQELSGASLVKKPKVPLFVYQFLILVAGVVLTIFAFMATQSHIGGLQTQAYDRAGMAAAQDIGRYFGGLNQTAKNVAVALSVGVGGDRGRLVADVKGSFSGVEEFDQIIWLYQTPEKKWLFNTIYQRQAVGTKVKRYGLNIDREFLAYVVQKDPFSAQGATVMTNLSFTVQGGGSDDGGFSSLPFALVVPLKGNNPQAGVVMAVGSTARAFGQDWLTHNERVADLSIREMGTGHTIFSVKRPGRGFWNKEQKPIAYEFGFGDKTWEVDARLVTSPQTALLKILPICVMVLGFLGTALMALYMRESSDKTAEVHEIQATLERKNLELQTQIEERERLNDMLRKSEKDHRSIIDAVSDVIFETNVSGHIVFLSARWRSITGFDPQQSKGMDLFSMLHADDQERLREDFALLVEGQKEAFRSFTRLRTSNGSFRAVELAISMTRQDRNKDLRVVGTFTDVEERRRAERALSEAEKKYRAIVENAAGGIFQITPEGLYLSANPALARILGYKTPESLLRTVKNANEQIYASQRERQMFLRELEKNGAINGYETRAIRKDGEVIWISENVRAVRDDGGNTLYYEGSIEDITERKETDIKLREAKVHSDLANRAKSEFLANMSHELRTPLNAIIGFSEIIKNESFGKVEPQAYLEYAKDINESGNKLLTVINEILDISRIEAGERQLNESIVNVDDLVMGCLDLLTTKVEANDMSVTTDLRGVPGVVAEELALKQVVMNLLSNAVKFTPNGGRITITSNLDSDGRLRLSITDTGVGLDEDEIKKALSPFGQLQNELSRSNSGTGLGLTLSDALVRLHGGELELFSQKGIGTTATIILPADRVQKNKVQASEKVENKSPGTSERENS